MRIVPYFQGHVKMDEMDDGLGNPRAKSEGQAPGLTSFLPLLRLGLRHIHRASAPALHPRLFRPARNQPTEKETS